MIAIERRVLPIHSHSTGFALTPDKPPLPKAKPGEQIRVKSWPQKDFVPERLNVRDGCSWVIDDILIGGESIIPDAAIKAINGCCFDLNRTMRISTRLDLEYEVLRRVHWRNIPKGECIEIVATYQGGDNPDGGELVGGLFGCVQAELR